LFATRVALFAGIAVGGAAQETPRDATAPGAAAAGAGPGRAFYANRFEKIPSVADLTAVGRALFVDPALSASGRVACATCHSPSRAFGPPNALPVQRAGIDGRRPGRRAVPSLMYAEDTPPFTEHFNDDDGDDSVDQGPAGGRTWDGRAASAHAQARLPLFSPFEMANADAGAVVARVARGAEARRIREAFGGHVFDDPAMAFDAVLLALETYQQDPGEFYPYTSKYDAWLRHRATLSPAEVRGLNAFNDPARGNCARCHPSAMRRGAFPQFTDHGYAALGVPRNDRIPANADPAYHDLGLCGPLRTDLAQHSEYCGLFRTPTLRNVATRTVFFHNGVMTRLEDAVRFYAQRDLRAAAWYPRQPGGAIRPFDDLPAPYQRNLDRGAPFDRRAGDGPALNDRDVQDIVAFLGTLTDGFVADAAPEKP